MTFPTPYTLSRKPFTGSTDSLGNTTASFGATVSVPVIAIAPHTVEQGSATLAETEVADLDVFAPAGTAVGLKDVFVVDGKDHEVVGVQDWTKGFHGWAPGIVIELRRVS